jgi:hypothetical protein
MDAESPVAMGIAMLLLGGCAASTEVPRFDTAAPPLSVEFLWSPPAEPYLQTLRTRYGLDDVVAGSTSDLERLRRVTHWAHTQWQHSTWRQPDKRDPITILEQARQGQSFRCTEYSIVLAGALNAIGIPARVVGLRADSMLKRWAGIDGHVVTEAYLPDVGRWAFADAQFDVVPTVNGMPASAVEFQQALAAPDPALALTRQSGSAETNYAGTDYRAWVAAHLFYLDTRLDQRYGSERTNRFIQLRPRGTKALAATDREMVYTEAVTAFYPAPRPPQAATP